MNNLLIRHATFEEMPLVMDLVELNGCNPGKYDHEFLYGADPTGFLLLLQEQQVFGSICSIGYDDTFGFIGCHNFVENFNDNGLKKKLLDVAIERLGSRNIGLNCPEDSAEFYNESGFNIYHKIYRFKGTSSGELPNSPDITSLFAHSADFLIEYESQFFPVERKNFLAGWYSQTGSLALGKFVDEKYKGYGIIRPCRKGYSIAPLFADNPAIAEELLLQLVGHFPEGTEYYVDIPEQNENAIQLAEKLKLSKDQTFVRMYNKEKPKLPYQNIYGFTSLEVG